MPHRQLYEYLVTVEGQGIFPLDAMRIERLWPATEADSARIQSTLHYGHLEGQLVHHIRLNGHHTHGWHPLFAVWCDHGWVVVEHSLVREVDAEGM